jgi:hypothetical protein
VKVVSQEKSSNPEHSFKMPVEESHLNRLVFQQNRSPLLLQPAMPAGSPGAGVAKGRQVFSPVSDRIMLKTFVTSDAGALRPDRRRARPNYSWWHTNAIGS